MAELVIDVDFAVLRIPEPGYDALLSWGERVTVVDEDADSYRVTVPRWGAELPGSPVEERLEGRIPKTVRVEGRQVPVAVPPEGSRVLRMSFVDVQQGDGTVVQTPEGRTLVVDGGENAMFARFFASRHRGSSPDRRAPIDAIVVSHGDADHFAGLVRLHEAEEDGEFFARPRRVFHNGLVKGPDADVEKTFGRVVPHDDDLYAVDLEDDLTRVPPERMNTPFRRWRAALEAWERDAGNIAFRRLARGDDDAFGFLDDAIAVEVLAPMPRKVGPRRQWGLPLLPAPRDGVPMDNLDFEAGALSASHTINGHSVVLRLTYGNVRVLLSGDLNNAGEHILTAAHADGSLDLTSEVFKVPHHGSHEFEPGFLKAVSPVVSIVSSGDDTARTEHIHPRASLVSSLGRYARDDQSLVFVTELVAFFKYRGRSRVERPASPADAAVFLGFERSAYGLVRVRTDGQRLFVFTDSGKRDAKEAYAYTVDASHQVTAVPVVKARLPRGG